jgi:hypothetical protein
LAAIIDELCFFGLDEESKVRSDTELIRAIQPSLATTNGKLVCISSPYAKKGWGFNTHKKHFGNDAGTVLIWNCPSRTMNPTLSQKIVDAAMAEDMASAKAEYMGEFRDDVGLFLPREIIQSCVISGRKELLPRLTSCTYFGFCDVSGGRNDAAALCIGHRNEQKKVVMDFIKKYSAPHNPYEVVASMSEQLKRFGLRKITGDNFSAQFVCDAFQANGIRYEKSELPKSGLYLELLPLICSNMIELLDDETLINQLTSLERRTRSGGKDLIDHAPSGHDDVANAAAGVAVICGKRKIVVGSFF